MSERPGHPAFEPPAGSTPRQGPQEPPQPFPPQQPFGHAYAQQPWQPAAAPQPSAPQQLPPPRRRGAGQLVALVLAASLLGGGVGSVATLAATDRPVQQTTQGSTTTPVVASQGDAVDWAAVARSVEPAVVSINVQTGQGDSQGSGVLLDAQGNIATNNHVIDGGQNGEISVTLNDNTIHRATVVGTDPGSDLAVIRLADPPADITPIAFGDVTQLAVGDPVMAIGNPLGLSGSVTTGIVSALHRPVQSSSAPQQRSPFDPGGNQTGADTVVTDAIQTSAAINPGNSGGALVNAQGQLVGITSSIATLSGDSGVSSGNIGIGFAIRADQVRSVTTSIITTGSAVTPFLGVSTTDGVADVGGSSVVGAEIAEVTSGSPADDAGLRPGDVVISMDDVPIVGSVSLAARVRSEQVGDEVSLEVSRDSGTEKVTVTLAGR